jgi:hypothetical protein
VHLNRYVVRHDFTGKHAVPFYAIVTFFFLPVPTVSHCLRDSAVDRAFCVFRYCNRPPSTYFPLPFPQIAIPSQVSQANLQSMFTGIYSSFSLLFSALVSHYSFVVIFAVD